MCTVLPCVSVHLFLSSMYLSLYLFMYLCLSIFISILILIYLSLYLFLYLFIIYLYICVSTYLSIIYPYPSKIVPESTIYIILFPLIFSKHFTVGTTFYLPRPSLMHR